MLLHNIIEKRLIQNLLRLDTCTFETNSSLRNKNYFLGLRKGVYLLDVERSILVYFKVLSILRRLKKDKIRLLFIGSPFGLESKLKNIYPKSHSCFSFKEWNLGALSNSKNLRKNSYFLVAYSQERSFYSLDSFTTGIPSIGFLDNLEKDALVDYPIFLNLHSKGSIGLFLYLLNQSLEDA